MPVERTAQRNLNDAGVRDARQMGVVFRKYQIAFAEIITSPMYRARETAEYAYGKPTSTTMALRVFPSTEEQAALVASPVKPGTNRLLVTHHFVIEKHIPGIRPGDIDESEGVVIRVPASGKVELVGRIKLEDWQQLSGAAAEPNAAHATVPSMPPQVVEPLPADFKSPVIPDTPAGRLARKYLEAIASGDESRMRTFIESSLMPNPERPTDVRVAAFAKTSSDFGKIIVTGIQSSADKEITLNIRTARGNFLLITRVSPADAQRAESIAIATTQGGHG
jgi:phosphohistidine phosphatase SixA